VNAKPIKIEFDPAKAYEKVKTYARDLGDQANVAMDHATEKWSEIQENLGETYEDFVDKAVGIWEKVDLSDPRIITAIDKCNEMVKRALITAEESTKIATEAIQLEGEHALIFVQNMYGLAKGRYERLTRSRWVRLRDRVTSVALGIRDSHTWPLIKVGIITILIICAGACSFRLYYKLTVLLTPRTISVRGPVQTFATVQDLRVDGHLVRNLKWLKKNSDTNFFAPLPINDIKRLALAKLYQLPSQTAWQTHAPLIQDWRALNTHIALGEHNIDKLLNQDTLVASMIERDVVLYDFRSTFSIAGIFKPLTTFRKTDPEWESEEVSIPVKVRMASERPDRLRRTNELLVTSKVKKAVFVQYNGWHKAVIKIAYHEGLTGHVERQGLATGDWNLDSLKCFAATMQTEHCAFQPGTYTSLLELSAEMVYYDHIYKTERKANFQRPEHL
jgi:hypothetical protein